MKEGKGMERVKVRGIRTNDVAGWAGLSIIILVGESGAVSIGRLMALCDICASICLAYPKSMSAHHVPHI